MIDFHEEMEILLCRQIFSPILPRKKKSVNGEIVSEILS